MRTPNPLGRRFVGRTGRAGRLAAPRNDTERKRRPGLTGSVVYRPFEADFAGGKSVPAAFSEVFSTPDVAATTPAAAAAAAFFCSAAKCSSSIFCAIAPTTNPTTNVPAIATRALDRIVAGG